MRRLLLMALFFSGIGFIAKAQSGGKVWGTVNDAAGNPIPSVTVSLLKANDSSLIKVAVSEKNGQYEFANIAGGDYLAAFTSVGFEKITSPAFAVKTDETTSVGQTTLQEASKGLSGVTVQSRRPLVEHKIDKMVVNVDASPTNAGATALEVLEKSPGISVDRDGNISLKGKQGIIVLMDGKQTYLSGQDLANLLRNMPSSQLDQIEIMTQPSAKFDASGNSGIINLRTKKSTQKGFNGSVSVGYVQGKYPKSPNSFNFNYRQGRINLFTNLSYSYWSGFSDQTLLRSFRNDAGNLTSVFDQKADQKFHGQNFSGRFGLDFTVDKKTTIGFLVNGIYNPRLWQNNGRANIYNGSRTLDSINIAQTENRDTWKNFGANVNFRRTLGGKRPAN